MPGKVERSILASGRSRVVVIPPAWLRFYNLEKGDTVELIYNGLILIKPAGMPLTSEDLRRELETLERLMLWKEAVKRDETIR